MQRAKAVLAVLVALIAAVFLLWLSSLPAPELPAPTSNADAGDDWPWTLPLLF